MNHKKTIIWQFIAVICISIGLGYSLVFAGITGSIEFKTTENVFVDSLNLNKAKVYLKSSNDLTNIRISGNCSPYGRLTEKSGEIYVFEISFNDKLCNKEKAIVYFNRGDLRLSTSFNILSDYSLYSQYLDYSNDELNTYLELTRLAEEKLQESGNASRKLEELDYMRKFIEDILTKRQDKYLIPIKGVQMPTQSTRLPNSGRPYRASYTDGVHEGWDFYTDFGNVIQALDYGLVVKIVKNFDFSDLGKLKQTGNITELDKMRNLDILRGNQVWVKTMKGDVAFYAHLNEVFDNVKVGDVVFKGQALGSVGISGVPDKEYSDYHLHLEVHKNPYLSHKKPYSLENYMAWDWYFKGEKEKYILEHQDEVFRESK